MENLTNEKEQDLNVSEAQEQSEKKDKKKVSLADFKVKSFVTNVKVEQMQFLKTAGG